jgi:hypothetical protein
MEKIAQGMEMIRLLSIIMLSCTISGCIKTYDESIETVSTEKSFPNGKWKAYAFVNPENVEKILNGLDENQLPLVKIFQRREIIYIIVPQCGKLVQCKQ